MPMTTQRSFALLCAIGVFCFISYNMVRMPVLALFAESLGAGPERIGLIVSVSTLTGVFLKLPSGGFSCGSASSRSDCHPSSIRSSRI
jgi:MFS transporter, DHA1 family, multidrug resistance protein